MKEEISGCVRYDPDAFKKAFRPWWSILKVDNNIVKELKHIVLLEHNIRLQNPLWGGHVSVVRGEEPIYKEFWRKYEKEYVRITLDLQIRTTGKYWFVRCQCPRIEEIRRELGLKPSPARGAHLTIGNDPLWETRKFI